MRIELLFYLPKNTGLETSTAEISWEKEIVYLWAFASPRHILIRREAREVRSLEQWQSPRTGRQNTEAEQLVRSCCQIWSPETNVRTHPALYYLPKWFWSDLGGRFLHNRSAVVDERKEKVNLLILNMESSMKCHTILRSWSKNSTNRSDNFFLNESDTQLRDLKSYRIMYQASSWSWMLYAFMVMTDGCLYMYSSRRCMQVAAMGDSMITLF